MGRRKVSGQAKVMRPVYRKVHDNLLLIGVQHKEFTGMGPTAEIKRFRKALGKADHIILEGNRETYKLKVAMGPRDFETIAYLHSGGKKHFLLDGVCLLSLLEEKGISKTAFATFKSLSVFEKMCAQDYDEVKAEVKTFLEIGKRKLGQAIPSEDVERVSEAVPLLPIAMAAKLGEDSLGIVGDIFGAFQDFLARTRDYEVYSEKLLRMDPELDGMKVGVFGANHILALEPILKGGPIPSLEWSQYLSSLDALVRAGVMFVEEFAQKINEGSVIRFVQGIVNSPDSKIR